MTFRHWVYVAVGLFAAGLTAGLALPAGAIAEELSIFSETFEDTENLDAAGMLVFILFSNITAFLTSFFFAPLLLLIPIGSLFLNGAVITLVVRLVLEEQSVWYVIAGLAPHGIIEIPAYLMVMAASLSFGFAVLRGLFQPGYRPEVMPQAKANLRRLGIGLVLLVPAALIESFITPLFLGWFG
ncbi:protein of unknown function DUF95 transmembrane [Dehalogenimonas lykanthroporepellens BL-DC-9]|jgi:stage II sporulation protein M|nr:protein of unknown function DUF95 transmembrane [Dehalogenimonas lykanthroporepellens BL-DC-9]